MRRGRLARIAVELSGRALRIPELAACGFAACWFCYLGFRPILDPTRVAWMLREDWAAFFWGFCFFRNSAWSFPLGATPELLWPAGTTVGFTDSNPWVALAFKALSPLLPADFQYAGIWFLACFVLQAFVGTRITRTLTADPVVQALGGCLFALSPLFLGRYSHVTLCGFFFLSAAIALNLRPVKARSDLQSLAVAALGLLVWSAGTHGYLSVMTLLLVLALCLRLRCGSALLSTLEMGGAVLLALLATLGTYYAFGYVGGQSVVMTAGGFGRFSSDVNALINPQGWSRFLPSLQPPMGEGYCYLGLGVLLLLLLATVRAAQDVRRTGAALRAHWPLLLAVFCMWVYALGPQVRVFGMKLLDARALYEPLHPLTGVLRGNGRFSWPLNLTLTVAAIWAAATLRQRIAGRFALALAVALQAVELSRSPLSFTDVPVADLSDPSWRSLGAHYRHLQLVPIQLLWVCRYDEVLVNRLSYAAYRHKLTFNSGNASRRDPALRNDCDRGLGTAELDAQTVYVVERKYLRQFKRRGAVCGSLDGLTACVSEANRSPLLAALREHRVL